MVALDEPGVGHDQPPAVQDVVRDQPVEERLHLCPELRRLAVELRDVGFMDSAGLGALLAIRERTQRLGIEMRLVDVSVPVRRILALTGAEAVFGD